MCCRRVIARRRSAGAITPFCCCWRVWGCGPARSSRSNSTTSSGVPGRSSCAAASGCHRTDSPWWPRSATRSPPISVGIARHTRRGECFSVRRAPRRGFANPSTVSTIVRRALARAGLSPALKGAHLFRHSLATRMLRHGASLPEIGMVLRHRAVQTTEIYAKVDLAGLRALAQPWPEMGGAR